jgi:hypothetical protein
MCALRKDGVVSFMDGIKDIRTVRPTPDSSGAGNAKKKPLIAEQIVYVWGELFT